MYVNLDTGEVRTTVAERKEDVDDAIQTLMSSFDNYTKVIGLDAMMNPLTDGRIEIVTLQLCDKKNCLVIPFYLFEEIPQSLYNFLSYPRFTFAGVGIKDALSRLKEEYGLLCKNVLEVGPSSWGNYSNLTSCFRGFLLSSRVPDNRNSQESDFFCRRGRGGGGGGGLSVSDVWGSGEALTFDEITIAVSNAHASFRIGELMISP